MVNKPIFDKYYTNLDVANLCCDIFKKYVDLKPDDIIIEPSAGNGSFISPLKQLSKNTIFIDIKPENKEVKKCDFLKSNFKSANDIHVVGNPPFGFKSSSAIKFIKHSCSFCKTLAFILPKSFMKPSMQATVPLNFHLISTTHLPMNSFYNKSTELRIPCVFQIWEKRHYNRRQHKKIEPFMYRFTTMKKADIAIRRVGHLAGHIYKNDISNKNINTHYFVKFDNKEHINSISNINIKSNEYVIGPKSISKKDIIKNLNRQINNVI